MTRPDIFKAVEIFTNREITAVAIKTVLREDASDSLIRRVMVPLRDALQNMLTKIQEDPFVLDGLKPVTKEQLGELLDLMKRHGFSSQRVAKLIGLPGNQRMKLLRKEVISMTKDQWGKYEELVKGLKFLGSEYDSAPLSRWEKPEGVYTAMDPDMVIDTAEHRGHGFGGITSQARWVSSRRPCLAEGEGWYPEDLLD